MRIRSFMLAGVSLAVATTAALAANGGVYFRGTDTFGARQARDAAPKLVFAPATGLLLGGTASSEAATFTGPAEAFRLTASGGEIRVCPASGQCGSWGTTGTVKDGEAVQARRAGPTAPGQTVQVEVTGLNLKATFDATARSSTPSLGSFASKTVSPDVVAESALSTFTGWVSTRLTVSGGEARVCSSQGACGSWSASSDVHDGDQVQLRGVAGTFGTTKTVTASAGGASATFDVATRAKDTVPDAIAFGPAVTGLEPGATASSTIVTLAGFDDAPISITGGEYALNGGSWTTAAGPARAGDKVQIRTTGGSFGETRTVTLDVGGVKAAFSATVRVKDTQPDAFALGTGPTGVEPGSISTSNQVTLAGFDDAPVTVSGTGATYSLNGAAYTASAGTAKAGDTVRVQLTAGAVGETRQATLAVGGTSASWSSTVRVRDVVPDTVTFPALTDQEPSTLVVSAIRQLTGHDGVTVTVTGTGAQVRACATADCASGSWGTSADVAKDAYVQMRTTTGAIGATVQASLAYGATTPATWSVSTKASATAAAGTLYAWGQNSYGQIGIGSTDGPIYTPAKVIMPAGVTAFSGVSTYLFTTCATGSDNALYCWGNNGNGQVGVGHTTTVSMPTKVTLPAGVTALKDVSVGSYHACATGSDNAAYCWGTNGFGELGNGTTSASTTPTKVTMPSGVTSITNVKTGHYATCGTGSDGNAYCWGYNPYGGLGDGTTSNSAIPKKVTVPAGESRIVVTSVGHTTSCGFGSSGAAYCWGYNPYGGLGDGTTSHSAIPKKVNLPSGVSRFESLDTSAYQTCGNGSDGNAYCWGYNVYGQIGNGMTTDVATPVKVTAPSGTTSIRVTDVGLYRACGVGSDNHAYCWGYGYAGALGNMNENNSSVPTKVSLPGGVAGFVNPLTSWYTGYAIAR